MTLAPDTVETTPGLAWLTGLRAHGERPAIVTAAATRSYADLARAVDAAAEGLGGPRRLVMVQMRATFDSVVAYLGALQAGHVVLLTAADADDAAGRLRAAYDPDVVLGPDGAVEVLRQQSVHELHPELALLLSTSGSTGSPKLVRLSADNLAANAGQIDAYLDVRPDDCAALTLPLSYCYGLSVLHTHLAAGASVLLTDLSVVDECFWQLFERAGATTFPGVPHTFELLERSGFADRHLPRLRYVTQAGGRMDPDRVRAFAELGARRGWDLYVMYGQSEATARMTYLRPDLARQHPDAVGRPVRGGSVTIEDGEVVFRGPNVMLGYAEGAVDLARGRTVRELRTGDLGRFTPEGLLQVVGRRARFVKVLGHRVDLDVVEQRLRALGHDVRCAGRDGLLVVTARGAQHAPARETVRRAAVAACGAPAHAVAVVAVDEHPTLETGKPDYAAVLRLGDLAAGSDGWVDSDGSGGSDGSDGSGPAVAERSVAEVYGRLLQRPVVGDDATFASLGGDSLSYVEVSIHLEDLLGQLPASWHVMPVRDLERLRSAPAEVAPGRWAGLLRRRSVESSVWLRALAIVLIVGTHAKLFTLQGTANALLVIAGHQLVRFQLATDDRRARLAGIGKAVLRIVAPTVLVIAVAHVVAGRYEPRNLVLANWLLGEPRLGPPWRFWFVEALVVALAVSAALLAVPAFHRLERRYPLAVPLALTAAAFILFRLPLLDLPFPRMQGSAPVVLYLFFLGWSLGRTRNWRQRAGTSLLVVATVGTFSGNPWRDGLTVAFVLVLTWWPVARLPAFLVPVVGPLAAASLYIYVIHWQVLELLWGRPLPAFVGSLAAGVAYWWLWSRGAGLVHRSKRRVSLARSARRHRPACPGTSRTRGR